jgi:hypothetical protein
MQRWSKQWNKTILAKRGKAIPDNGKDHNGTAQGYQLEVTLYATEYQNLPEPE